MLGAARIADGTVRKKRCVLVAYSSGVLIGHGELKRNKMEGLEKLNIECAVVMSS